MGYKQDGNLRKKHPYILDQKIRLLKGRKVTTLRHLRPLYYVVCLSNPAKRTGKYLLWKIRVRHGSLQAWQWRHFSAGEPVLTIDSHRGANRIGRPIESDIGQKCVAVHCCKKIAVIVSKQLKSSDHPGQPPDRGVRQGIGNGLRFSGLNSVKAAFFAVKVRKPSPLRIAHLRNCFRVRRIRGKKVQMKADHVRGCLVSHVARDFRTPVAALDTVLGIAQTIHQNDQSLRHPPWIPTPSCGGSGESKSRKRRNDDVKCRAIFVPGMSKWLDESQKLHNRTGPTVNQHQGYGIRSLGPLVDEVDFLPINFCRELVKAVDLGFLRAPIVLVLPIIREFSDLLDVGTVFPCRARKLIGPFGFRQTAPKTNENLVRNMRFERENCGRLRLCRHLRLPKRN